MKRFFFLFFFFIFVAFTPKIYASDFSTTYKVNYTISENENTHVQINISLLNKTDVYYASSYKIHLGFENIANVKANDNSGSILKGVEKEDGQDVVNVTFNDKVTGVNNKLNFSISFDTSNVAQKIGKIWEVNIPGLSDQSDISDFGVGVTVPSSLGKAIYIKPNVKNPNVSGNTYNFSRSDLGNSGISMTFGSEQIYALNLTYHLYNNNLFPIKTEIALPPNTNYQEVEIDSINEKPTDVKIDKDGNWLAEYNLSPSQKKDIIVKGKVKVKLNPERQFQSKSELATYLKTDKYWETTDNRIKDKAKELKTPHEIYKFVSDYLSYDYSRVASEKPRLGATKIFSNPKSAVCLEFTDLFIAIARAAGIPAREIDGYAYTQDTKERPLSLVKDVLHAWPEYYDTQRQSWIMVDPTWANTTGGMDFFDTLDFDHIAFVIKGYNSTYPVPAGGYKLPGKETIKDVNVSFAEFSNENSPVIELTNKFPNKLIAGFASKGAITVKNTGKIETPEQKIILISDTLTPKRQFATIPRIPPYGLYDTSVSYDKTPILTNTSDTVRIILGASTFSYKIKITPFFLSVWFLTGGCLILAGLIIIISIIAIKSRNISVFGRKKQSALRGQSQES